MVVHFGILNVAENLHFVFEMKSNRNAVEHANECDAFSTYVIKLMRWNKIVFGNFLYKLQSEEHIRQLEQYNVTHVFEFRVSECVQVVCETLYNAGDDMVTHQTSRSGQSKKTVQLTLLIASVNNPNVKIAGVKKFNNECLLVI